MTSSSTGADSRADVGDAGQSQSAASGLYGWLDERYRLTDVIEFARHKSVPVHRGSIWYFFGGVALFLFVVQVITGALLLVYYRADVDVAFETDYRSAVEELVGGIQS